MVYEEIQISGYSLVRVYEEVASTMDVARSMLESVGNRLVIARRQLAGRGRQGRSWHSSNSAFMGTFVFDTEKPTSMLTGYSLAVGVAIAEAVESLGGEVRLKWPNDLVVVNGGSLYKLGGVLIEVEERASHRAVLVGLGINVEDAPSDIPHASSLRESCGLELSVDDVISPLAHSLLRAHDSFCAHGGFEAFRARWIDRSCFTVDQSSLTVDLGREVVSGVFQGIEASGALVLRSAAGERVVHSGHVLEWSL
jgi:BirA family biotin operon repressor/biotin-[acetyl-CoA-carboxylase] ligase